MYLVRPEEEEIERIKSILSDLEEYYSVKLSQRQRELYIEDLIPMGSSNVLRAAVKYRTTAGNCHFPLPVQLRSSVMFFKKHGCLA